MSNPSNGQTSVGSGADRTGRGDPASLLESLILAARYHAIQLTQSQLIREHLLGNPNVSWDGLVSLARKSGLKAVSSRVSWKNATKLGRAVPAIIRLRNGNAMVVTKVEVINNVTCLIVRDPLADGEAGLAMDENRFRSACTGEVILIKRDYALGDEEQPFGIRQIAGFILRSKQIVINLAICAFFMGLLSYAPIIFWRILFDRVISFKSFSTFYVLCSAFGIVIVFEIAFNWIKRHLVQNIIARVDALIWTSVFDTILKLPVTYFEKTPTGLITRNIFELFKIRTFLVNLLFGTALDSLILVIFIPVMFFFSMTLSFVVIGLCGLICLWIIVMLPTVHRISGLVQAAESRKGSFLVETLHGMRTVKSLALEPRRRKEWDRLVADAVHRRYDEASISNLVSTVLLPLERLMSSGVLALAVYMAISSTEQIYSGALIGFIMLASRVSSPLVELARSINGYDEARLAVEMIKGMVEQPKELGRSQFSLHTPLRGQVEFQSVTFAYPGSIVPALDNVSFTIPEGKIFGIMGRSGSGKTTVTRLLQMLNTDYRGQIRLDGRNLNEFNIDHLRSSVGVVLQDNFLFSGTISESISATKPNATYDEIVHAARLAGAEEFIDRLPDGYNTYIHEGSTNLSGGQRQRLAIARALISDPKIVIFDEATSALDADSEAIVNANLFNLAKGRTVIIITHRLSSLVVADSILVLERGKVYDLGRHDELMVRCDIYRGLWHQQHRHLERTR